MSRQHYGWRLVLARFTLPAITVLLLLLTFVGCGSDSSTGSAATPGGGGGGTGGGSQPVLSPSRFIYGGPGFEVDGFVGGIINTSTGKVTPMPGMFVDGLEQGNLLQILTDARGRFVFTMREQASSFGMPVGKSGISSFQINSQSGLLTLAPNSPIIFPKNDNAAEVFLDGLGRFLFQPRLRTPAGFDIYSVDQTSGALSKIVPSNVAPLGGASVGSPDGRFIFDSGGGNVQTLAVDGAGQLAFVATASANGGGDGPMVVSPDGRFLYSADSSQRMIAVFGVGADGRLTPMAGSPFNISPGLISLALTPDGRFLYGIFDAGLEGFSINASTGTFTPIALGSIPATAFTLDRAGKFAFVTDINAQNPVLTTFSIDPNTGALASVSTATDPVTDLPTNLTTAP